MTFGLFGGLALFLYGMEKMSEGLKKSAGSKMRSILEALTRNRVIAFLVGAFVTVVIQSSSATTVMLVSFVQAELMSFAQALGVILGADIGTTITAELAAIKGNINAKRTARAHTAFNIIGVIYMLPLVWTGVYPKFVEWIVPGGITQKTIMINIAMSHTIFNVLNKK